MITGTKQIPTYASERDPFCPAPGSKKFAGRDLFPKLPRSPMAASRRKQQQQQQQQQQHPSRTETPPGGRFYGRPRRRGGGGGADADADTMERSQPPPPPSGGGPCTTCSEHNWCTCRPAPSHKASHKQPSTFCLLPQSPIRSMRKAGKAVAGPPTTVKPNTGSTPASRGGSSIPLRRVPVVPFSMWDQEADTRSAEAVSRSYMVHASHNAGASLPSDAPYVIGPGEGGEGDEGGEGGEDGYTNITKVDGSSSNNAISSGNNNTAATRLATNNNAISTLMSSSNPLIHTPPILVNPTIGDVSSSPEQAVLRAIVARDKLLRSVRHIAAMSEPLWVCGKLLSSPSLKPSAPHHSPPPARPPFVVCLTEPRRRGILFVFVNNRFSPSPYPPTTDLAEKLRALRWATVDVVELICAWRRHAGAPFPFI